MARYIDADLFKKNIKIVTPDRFANCDNCGLYDEIDIKIMIDKQPTADVQEVKHGHWVEKPLIYDLAFCSICEYRLYDDNTPYCPNCGAKMDEEVSPDVR